MDRPPAQAHGETWMWRDPSHPCRDNILAEGLYSSLKAPAFSSRTYQSFELDHRIKNTEVEGTHKNQIQLLSCHHLAVSLHLLLAPGWLAFFQDSGIRVIKAHFGCALSSCEPLCLKLDVLSGQLMKATDPSQYRAPWRLDLTCLLSLHSYTFTNRFLSLF